MINSESIGKKYQHTQINGIDIKHQRAYRRALDNANFSQVIDAQVGHELVVTKLTLSQMVEAVKLEYRSDTDDSLRKQISVLLMR